MTQANNQATEPHVKAERLADGRVMVVLPSESRRDAELIDCATIHHCSTYFLHPDVAEAIIAAVAQGQLAAGEATETVSTPPRRNVLTPLLGAVVGFLIVDSLSLFPDDNAL